MGSAFFLAGISTVDPLLRNLRRWWDLASQASQASKTKVLQVKILKPVKPVKLVDSGSEIFAVIESIRFHPVTRLQPLFDWLKSITG